MDNASGLNFGDLNFEVGKVDNRSLNSKKASVHAKYPGEDYILLQGLNREAQKKITRTILSPTLAAKLGFLLKNREKDQSEIAVQVIGKDGAGNVKAIGIRNISGTSDEALRERALSVSKEGSVSDQHMYKALRKLFNLDGEEFAFEDVFLDVSIVADGEGNNIAVAASVKNLDEVNAAVADTASDAMESVPAPSEDDELQGSPEVAPASEEVPSEDRFPADDVQDEAPTQEAPQGSWPQ